MSGEPKQNLGRGLTDRKLIEAPNCSSNFIAGRPKAVLLFWFLMVLEMVYGYVLLFLLDIKIENR